MRVLCLNPYLPPPAGGIEKEMLAVAGELVALGHSVHCLTTTARFPAGENPPPGGIPPGVETVRRRGYLRSVLSGFNPSRAPLLVPGLAAAARRSRPDLVLVFNVGWRPALGPALGALSPLAPVLYRTYFHPPGGRLRRAKTAYILGAVALADRAFVATEGERAELAATGRLAAERIAVIPPGVHLHPADPALVERLRQELGLKGKVVIAHVARLSRFKGTLDLIETLPEVRKRTGRDVVLLLVGPEEGGDLRQAAARAGVAPEVCFIGEVGEDRVLRALLAAADLFALPSRYEAFGIAYIEALAEGLPCVGCDVGGVREAVAEAGLLIPGFGDRRALVEVLVRLVADRELRRTLGARGRERVLATLTWRRTAERLLELGEQARASRSQGSGR